MTPSDRDLPWLDPDAEDKLADALQPMLQMFRLLYYEKIDASQYPGFLEISSAPAGQCPRSCGTNVGELIVDAEVFQANGTAERDAALIMLEKLPGTQPVTVGGDKGFDTFGFVAPQSAGGAACGAERGTARRQRDRWPHHAALRLCHQSKKEETDRRMLRLAE